MRILRRITLFVSTFKPLVCPALGLMLLLLPIWITWLLGLAWLPHKPPWEPTTAVEFSGLLLQLTGLLTVAIGLSRARETFGERGLPRWLHHAFRRLKNIFSPPEPVTGKAHMELEPGTVQGRGVHLAERVGNDLESRVDYLEQQLDQAAQEIRNLQEQLTATQQNTARVLSAERKERQEEDQRLGAQMKEAVVGGIHVEATGVFYIAVGIVLTTFPGLIA